MTGRELGRAQRILGTLRREVDSSIARVVHQDVQGEGVAEGQFGTPISDAVVLDAVRHWPEAGWPYNLEER